MRSCARCPAGPKRSSRSCHSRAASRTGTTSSRSTGRATCCACPDETPRARHRPSQRAQSRGRGSRRGRRARGRGVPARQRLLRISVVEGARVPEEELRTGDALELVVTSVRRLHACPPIPSTFPVFRIVERYRETAASRGVTSPPAYEDAHALADRIEAAFATSPSPSRRVTTICSTRTSCATATTSGSSTTSTRA